MAIATGTALALSAGASLAGGAIAANAAKKAQQGANNTNQAIADQTNATNERLFRISRGEVDPSTGYANSILPAYFKGGEAELAQSAMDYFHQLQGNNANGQIANRLQGNLDTLHPAIQASLTALGNRYNGMDLQQRLQNAAPVFGARTNYASQQRASIDQSLLETMGQLNAQRARGGFYGNSTFDRSRLLAATLGARGQASNLMSGANLTNAEDERAMRDANLSGMYDSAPLANALQNAGIAYNSPATSLADYYTKSMQPFNFFRIGNQPFQQQPGPQVQPVLGGGGTFGSALGGLGSTGMNYLLQNQLYRQIGQNPYGGGAYNANDPWNASTIQAANNTSYLPGGG